jgi:hypothetical protein
MCVGRSKFSIPKGKLRVQCVCVYVCMYVCKVKVKSIPGAFSTLRPRGPIVFLPQQVPAFISRGATHRTDARDLYQAGTTPQLCQWV